jgi:hypothetical protein
VGLLLNLIMDISRFKDMTEHIYTDTLRHLEELYRCGAIDQERYLAIRMAILFNKKKKKK